MNGINETTGRRAAQVCAGCGCSLAQVGGRRTGVQFEIFEIPAPCGREQFEQVVAARRAAAER